MKKIIISFILSLSVATVAAQTDYYPGTTGTVKKSGYTYTYRGLKIADIVTPDIHELYNAANPYLDVKWGYKDGSEMSLEKALGDDKTPEISASSQTIRQTLTMVDALFSSSQKTALKGKSMSVDVRIDPSTGKIADVYFSFWRDSPFANIPVETYRSIELALKQNLTVTTTAEGRKMNYITLHWKQEF